MPTIFSKHGIVIQVFFVDHAPPHVHVLYGTHEAVLDHHALNVLEGSLPPEAMAAVQDIVDSEGKDAEGGLDIIRNHIKLLKKEPELVLTSPWRIHRAWVRSKYRIRLRFVDGFEGRIDLSRLVQQSMVFAALQDEALFKMVRLCAGVLTWPGGRDLAPDALYRNLRASSGTVLVL